MSTEQQNSLDTQVNFLLQGGSPSEIPQKNHADVISKLKELKSVSIDEEDYRKTQKIEMILTKFSEISEVTMYSQTRASKIRELEEACEKAQQDLDSANEKCRALSDQFFNARQKSLDDFDKEKQNELEEFTNNLLEHIPPNARKYSQQYLTLRKQEEFLVTSKRYVEANEIKKVADARQEEEDEEHRKKWAVHVKQIAKKKSAEIEQQRKCLESKWEQQWTRFQPSAYQEVDRCQKALQAAEAKLKVARTQSNNFPPLCRASGPIRSSPTRMRMTNYQNRAMKSCAPLNGQRGKHRMRI